MEFDIPIESIVLDVTINNRKWTVLGTYRPPSVKKVFSLTYLPKGWIGFPHIMTTCL